MFAIVASYDDGELVEFAFKITFDIISKWLTNMEVTVWLVVVVWFSDFLTVFYLI